MNVTVARLNRLSEICAGIGHVSLASIVIPFALDRFNPSMILLGGVTAIICWLISWALAR